jgi:hypothetical protein
MFTQADGAAPGTAGEATQNGNRDGLEKVAQMMVEGSHADALNENQDWQALADVNAKRAGELSARIAELEPVSAQADRYRGALETFLTAEKKDLPRHVLVLLEKLDLVDQVEYLAANREELLPKSAAAGVPASPEPKERTLSEEDLERARRGQASIYSNF